MKWNEMKWNETHDAPPDSLVGGEGHPSSYRTSSLPPSALATRRLGLRGIAPTYLPKIFFSKTTPGFTDAGRWWIFIVVAV